MTPPTSVTDATETDLDIHQAPLSASAYEAHTTHFHVFSYLLGALSAFLFLGGSLLLLRKPEPPPIVLQPPPTAAPTATPMPTSTPLPITVYVSGAVVQPGLYLLAADARVGDALASAGGLAEDADDFLINQAEKLWDGAQVHVPGHAPGEERSVMAGDPFPAPAAGPPAGVSGPDSSATGATGQNATGAGINVNTASAVELESLPGIGPSKAQAIIENRPYATIEDLTRAPGIGLKTVEQLRSLVVLQ